MVEEQAHTVGCEDSLLHCKAFLVVSSGDAEDVASEFGSQAGTVNLLGHALVHEVGEFAFVDYLDGLLLASRWVGNVELEEKLVWVGGKDDENANVEDGWMESV